MCNCTIGLTENGLQKIIAYPPNSSDFQCHSSNNRFLLNSKPPGPLSSPILAQYDQCRVCRLGLLLSLLTNAHSFSCQFQLLFADSFMLIATELQLLSSLSTSSASSKKGSTPAVPPATTSAPSTPRAAAKPDAPSVTPSLSLPAQPLPETKDAASRIDLSLGGESGGPPEFTIEESPPSGSSSSSSTPSGLNGCRSFGLLNETNSVGEF